MMKTPKQLADDLAYVTAPDHITPVPSGYRETEIPPLSRIATALERIADALAKDEIVTTVHDYANLVNTLNLNEVFDDVL